MKNIRFLLILLIFLIFTKIDPLRAQQPIICDTNAVGSIFLYTIPSRVLVEIPGLEIKGSKTDEAILIERAPPGKYKTRVSKGDKVLEYEIVVKPWTETRFTFDLKKQEVKLVRETPIPRPTIIYVVRDSSEHSYEDIFTVVEEQPGFPGGEDKRIQFLAENIHYPDSAKINGIQGKVFITFVVEKDGTLSDIRALRGIGGGCDEEAIRVVGLMPKWTPGRQRGTPVRVRFNLPIKFTLTSY